MGLVGPGLPSPGARAILSAQARGPGQAGLWQHYQRCKVYLSIAYEPWGLNELVD